MQFYKVVALFYVLICQCFALNAANCNLKLVGEGKKSIKIGSIDSSSDEIVLKEIVDITNVDNVIEFKCEVSEDFDQSLLLVGFPESNLEEYLEPVVNKKNDATSIFFKIEISKLSEALLSKSVNEQLPITASLLLAKEDDSKNILRGAFGFQPAKDISVVYNKPTRYGVKEEIVHTFRQAPVTASAFICQVFSFIIAGAVAVLIITWLVSGTVSAIKFPSGFQLVYFLVFITLIGSIEYVFVQYYLGESIFDTLYYTFLLGVPALLVGTKFLRGFNEL